MRTGWVSTVLLPFWSAMRRYWKLVERPDGEIELYNHRADPIERRNLYTREPGRISDGLTRMLEEFKTWEPVIKPETIEVEVDEELEKNLRSLGYVQ